MYRITYKHDVHGSDTLGCDFATVADAKAEIVAIESDPGKAGWAPWLQNAVLWVTDDNGNIC